MRSGPVYVVKPKYIFKHPFNKYDLTNPTNRQTQNEELTDYFNYGFNEDTMNIYGKMVKRFIQVLDHHKNLEYFNQPSDLMRLNDQIPMDFGGFCRFHDPWLIDNEMPQNFHDGQNLMRYFIMMIFMNASSKKVSYPLIEFITKMYKEEEDGPDQDTSLFDILEQIGKNLQTKYEQTMQKLIDKQNELKNPAQKKANHSNKDQPRDRERRVQSSKAGSEVEFESKRDKHRKSKSRRHSSDDDDSDDSQSEESSRNKKKSQSRRKDKHKSRDRDRDHKRKEKDRREKHKSKKVKKEKSYKRSRSRDRKKKHH